MYMPVPVYSEKNAVRNHAAEIAQWGRRALIVTGRHSAQNCGAWEDICSALQIHGVSYTVFDRVEENPSIGTITEAVQFARRENVDFVIGIGGGSPLDAAKAIAFLLAHPASGEELLYTPGDDAAFPLVLIPTTCGTGSEVTPYSVLTRTNLQTKKSISHQIYAKLALIDGKYLLSASPELIRNTALDALTHLMESELNVRADDFSRMYVQGGFTLFRQNRKVLYSGRPDEKQCQELMNYAAMAGMAIAQTSTTIPHGLSYSLTIHLNVPHGKAVGYFMSGYLHAAPERERNQLLQEAGFSDLSAFQNWYRELYGEPQVDDEILTNAVNALKNNPQKLAAASFPVSPEILQEMAFFMKR